MAITTSLSRIGMPFTVIRTAGLVMLALSLPGRAYGVQWTFVPSFGLRENYSDNIRFSSSRDAKSEWSSEFTPGIVVTGNSSHLKLNLLYQIQKLVYQSETDRTDQQLAASANVVLLEEHFFVDFRSTIQQQNLSAFGPQLIDNTHITDNQTTLKANRISPYYRHRFNGIASSELRYSHESVNSSNNFLTAKSDSMALNLVGDNGGRVWNWSANYHQTKNSDDVLKAVTMSGTTFSLQVPLTSSLNFVASTGYEKNDFQSNTSSEPAGRSWSAGTSWNPSARTSVNVSAGKRYFGNTYAINANHRSHDSILSIVYSEDITTSYSQFLTQSRTDASTLLNQLWQANIPDPVLRLQAIETYLGIAQVLGPTVGSVNYFSHRYFLQKQLNLSMAMSGSRSALILSFNANRRTAQTDSKIDSPLLGAAQFALEDQTRQLSGNVSWNWRMSARGSLNLTASYNKVQSESVAREDSNVVLNVGLSRQIARNTYVSVDLRNVKHNSSSGFNYRENGLRASLNLRF